MQKQQQKIETEIAVVNAKSEADMKKLQLEGETKKTLMDHEFQLNVQLQRMESENQTRRENSKEDRLDKRARLDATHKSAHIDQKENKKPAKTFESAGNDIVGRGFSLGAFEPKETNY